MAYMFDFHGCYWLLLIFSWLSHTLFGSICEPHTGWDHVRELVPQHFFHSLQVCPGNLQPWTNSEHAKRFVTRHPELVRRKKEGLYTCNILQHLATLEQPASHCQGETTHEVDHLAPLKAMHISLAVRLSGCQDLSRSVKKHSGWTTAPRPFAEKQSSFGLTRQKAGPVSCPSARSFANWDDVLQCYACRQKRMPLDKFSRVFPSCRSCHRSPPWGWSLPPGNPSGLDCFGASRAAQLSLPLPQISACPASPTPWGEKSNSFGCPSSSCGRLLASPLLHLPHGRSPVAVNLERCLWSRCRHSSAPISCTMPCAGCRPSAPRRGSRRSGDSLPYCANTRWTWHPERPRWCTAAKARRWACEQCRACSPRVCLTWGEKKKSRFVSNCRTSISLKWIQMDPILVGTTRHIKHHLQEIQISGLRINSRLMQPLMNIISASV